MPAYVIASPTISNPKAYDEYKALSGPSLVPYGGRFVARGGEIAVLEGDWNPERVVLIEFPDMAKARTWYASPEYAKARAARAGAADMRMVLLEGLS